MTVDARGNTGTLCSGTYNIGAKNRGSYNTGNANAGDFNAGDLNTGHRNTGSYNKGDYNTGHYNGGSHNTGCFNSGNNCSGHFNTEDDSDGVFNGADYVAASDLPSMDGFKLVEWVPSAQMTEAHKTLNSARYATEHGGFLLEHKYKVAWKKFWATLSTERKEEFLDLAGFDSEVFKKITGIDVNAEEIGVVADVRVIEGRTYRLVQE